MLPSANARTGMSAFSSSAVAASRVLASSSTSTAVLRCCARIWDSEREALMSATGTPVAGVAKGSAERPASPASAARIACCVSRTARISLSSISSVTSGDAELLRPPLRTAPPVDLPERVVWPSFTAVRCGESPGLVSLPGLGGSAVSTGSSGSAGGAGGCAAPPPERRAAARVIRREPQPGQVTIASGFDSGPISALQRGQFIRATARLMAPGRCASIT